MAETRKKRAARQKRGRAGATKRQRARENAFRDLQGAVGFVIQEAPAEDRRLQREIDKLNKRLPDMLPKKRHRRREEKL